MSVNAVDVKGVLKRDDYIATISKWLAIQDYEALDIILATAISIYFPGDPVWLFIISPPGSTKTEILRSFTGDRICSISTLTPQSLISGLQGVKDTDLMPKLDGKLLIIKDFTSILSKKSEDQTAIFADLREAYDGYLEKSYGSGVGIKRYRANFGIIAGVTNAIDMYRIVHSLLGERFLRIRPKNDADLAIARASELTGQETEMRKAISEATTACMRYYTGIQPPPALLVDDDIQLKIQALANITAKLRTEVPRDRFHKVMVQPDAEVGTRLSKQFLRVGQSLSILYEHAYIGDREYKTLLRIARDSISPQKVSLVLALAGMEMLSTKEAGDRAKIPTETARELLEDLWSLNLLTRTGDNPFSWQLTDYMHNLLQTSGLNTQTTPRER
jgi:hypothetical protein